MRQGVLIPYVEILDKYTRLPFDLVEPSEIWLEMNYYGVGEFEIYTRATPRALACLKNGNYVKLPNKPFLWVIEKVNPTFTADNGLMISATGRQAKAIIGKRIINAQTQLATNLETAVSALVNKHAGVNASASRRILGLETAASEIVQTINETQVSYANLLTYTDELLQAYESGAELTIDGTALKYRAYKGADKSEEVIFSQMFDNLLSSDYSLDESNFRNFALIGGQGEGAERITTSVNLENKTGIDLAEIFVDAKDISSKYTDASGTEQELDLTTAAGLATYKTWLAERGRQSLAEYIRVESFAGDIDTTNNAYKFGVDYYLGDIVRVQDNRLGVYITPRVIKYTINQTASEYEEKMEYGG